METKWAPSLTSQGGSVDSRMLAPLGGARPCCTKSVLAFEPRFYVRCISIISSCNSCIKPRPTPMTMESKGNPSKINLFEGAADFPQNCTLEPRKGEIFRRGILRNRMEIFMSKVLSSFSGHGYE